MRHIEFEHLNKARAAGQEFAEALRDWYISNSRHRQRPEIQMTRTRLWTLTVGGNRALYAADTMEQLQEYFNLGVLDYEKKFIEHLNIGDVVTIASGVRRWTIVEADVTPTGVLLNLRVPQSKTPEARWVRAHQIVLRQRSSAAA